MVGVDEKSQTVVGADTNELSSWYQKIESKFNEGIAPVLISNLNILVENKTVVALLFETDRAPFVINNPNGGSFTHGVPLRVGTRTKCASHSDLIRLLSPIQRLPEVEVLGCELVVEPSKPFSSRTLKVTYCAPWQLNLFLDLYIAPNNSDRIVFPWHRCKCWIELPGTIPSLELKVSHFETPSWSTSSISPSMKVSNTEVIVTDPGGLMLFATKSVFEKYPNSTENIEVKFSLSLIGSDTPVLIRTSTSYPGFLEGEYYAYMPRKSKDSTSNDLGERSVQRDNHDKKHEEGI